MDFLLISEISNFIKLIKDIFLLIELKFEF